MNKENRSWNLLTIPNVLSLMRLLSIPPIIYCILQDDRRLFYLGIGLICFAILSDYFDGKLARKLNQVTEVGKIIDPIADKVAVGSVIMVLIAYRDFPIWAASIIIGRDLLILIVGLFWTTKFKYSIPSNLLGKITVSIIALMILGYILRLPQLWRTLLTVNAVGLTILSSIVYLVRLIRIYHQEKTST
ncbi:CDP-alcohol phosphatidyltransferase family protein [candidate division KSB1 bacterium]|nr:CDP-alcohol phosphatidyltransferase family protein [candidate division KSB1 bacterium]